MPELPEVEYGRKVADSAATGNIIEQAWAADDAIVFCKRSAREVERLLTGRRVHAVKRRGKYLWFELDQRPWPVFHFGMTGAFRCPEQTAIQLETGAKVQDSQWPPRFTKIHLHFAGGRELVMINPRRLGRISFHEDPPSEYPIAKLGFDPLTDMPSLADFRAGLDGRRGTLKGLLLNQKFAAGIGNWIADEVLYQARIDPRRPAQSLDKNESRSLYRSIRKVIELAVKVDAQKDQFPKTWLFHHRWGKQSAATTARGETIEFMTVAGRTTAWVPHVQS